MENLLLLLALTFATRTKSKDSKKMSIGKTGCSICPFCKPQCVTKTGAANGDVMYSGWCTEKGVTYGFVTVLLKKPAVATNDAERTLAGFMKSVFTSFSIAYNAGLMYGYTMKSHPAAIGIVDYWQDAQGRDWKVKGWTNGAVLTVMYVKNINELAAATGDAYLDSFQFPDK